MLADRLGLTRKPLRGTPPPPGEAGEGAGLNARAWAVRAALFAALAALTVAAFPRARALDLIYDVGEAWRGERLVAPFAFAILKDRAELAAERRAVRYEVPPYFRAVPDAPARVREQADTLTAQLDAVYEAYAAYRRAALAGDAPGALRDSIRYEGLRGFSRLRATPIAWRRLMDDRARRDPTLRAPGTPAPDGPPLGPGLLALAERAALGLAARGALDVSLDSVLTDVLTVRSEDDRTDRLQRKSVVEGLDGAYTEAARTFAAGFPDDPDAAALGEAFFRVVYAPSLAYMAEATEAEWAGHARRISPTRGVVRAGEPIVERGQRITPDVRRRLASLDAARAGAGAGRSLARTLAGQALLVLCTYGLFFLYLYLLRRSIFDSTRRLLAIVLIFAGVTGLYALAVRLASIEMLAVPVAVAAILLTVLYDSRVGVFGTLTLALLGGHLLRYDLAFAFLTLFGGTLVVFSVRDVKNRGQFFLSAALLFAAYAAALVAGYLVEHLSFERLVEDLTSAAVHAALVLFAYPLLWIFERAFGLTTDLTLLELSGTDRPLLRELQAEAPGTFSHVVAVASLAEACAGAIGANALLARVGALYHDIGKMAQPEYFVENQQRGENPHDALTPDLSADVIANHVRAGLALAEQHRLPEPVRHFIATHHGTTRIEFFYRKALDAAGPDGPPVDEAAFRYPGPRPDTRETAILMLADGTEAASRSLDDPSPQRIAHLVETLVEARRADGQLDRSDLTFYDLARIKETLVARLVGQHHARVKYPELPPMPASLPPSNGAPDPRNEAARGPIGDPARRADA